MTVTADAGFGWGNTGKIRLFNRGVTIAAVKPQAAYMLLMAKRHRLLFR